MKKIYLDNAATTPVFDEILEKIPEWSREYFANPNSIHSDGQKARRIIDESRRYIASVLNCEEEEIIFTSCATESNNTIIKGLAESYPEKNEIIVSPIEHKSVLNPVKYLTRKGYKVHFLKVDKNGLIDIDHLKNLINKKTLLVSVIHGNNETGVVQDVKEINRICKEKEIFFFSDTAQSFLKEDISDVDFLSVSGHKINAPKGIGFFKKRKNIKLTPLLHGGGQEFGLRSGTENVLGIKALAEAIKMWKENRNRFLQHLIELKKTFISLIEKELPGEEVVSQHVKTLPHIVSIIFRNVDAQTLIMALNAQGIEVSSGSACSSGTPSPSHVLLAYGFSEKEALSSVRFSFSIFNTQEEIEFTIIQLKNILNRLSNFPNLFSF
ncbi:MAG: cysteine desulfurase [Aquificae bacterium]|nr:cysteine desulfurase [Aquificota bacterium]